MPPIIESQNPTPSPGKLFHFHFLFPKPAKAGFSPLSDKDLKNES